MWQSNRPVSHLYNPATQTKQELLDGFVARQKEFRRIMRDINQSQLDEVSQNFLITAQRGMGKTTLLLRLEYEINFIPKLSHLIPIRLTEEQYNIVCLCDLWGVVADSLEDIEGFEDIVEQLESAMDEDRDNCFHIIKTALQKNGKKLLLLIDNFQDMLKKFTDNDKLYHKNNVKLLRDILHDTHLQLISASAIAIEDTYRHDKPFFEFFKTIPLKSLSTEESQELFKNLAKNHKDGIQNYEPSRIEIVKRLTGGVPRTMIIIFEIFLDKNAEIFENLEYILDQVTSLYKHRMDDLSSPSQRVAHEIAIAWDGITFEELQKKTRSKEETLRANLLELEKAYFVDSNHVGTEIEIYQLKERFFNIWYLMRNGRKKKKENIRWLIRFLEIWFTAPEITERVHGHILLLKERTIHAKGAYYLSEAYGEVLEDRELKHQLLSEAKECLSETSPELAKQITISGEIKNTIEDTSLSFVDKIKQLFINIFKKPSIYYYNMGNSYYNKGEYDRAIEAYQQAIKLNPKDNMAYNNMGINYDKKGDYDRAIEAYQQAIKLNPKDDSAYYNMGNSYAKKGEYDRAIEAYQQAIKLNPEYDNIYNNIGLCYYRKGDSHKSIELFEQAIKLNPKNDMAYYNMGIIYRNKGNHNKAIEAYQQIIKLNHKEDSAYYGMGISYANKGNYDKAIKLFKKAKEINSQDKYIFYYSYSLLANNQYSIAINELHKVLKSNDYLEFVEDMIEYFLLLIAKGQTQRLYSLFEQYPKLKNKFKPVYYTLMYFMQEEYPTEYKRMGSELEETVEEMIVKVKDMADKYGV